MTRNRLGDETSPYLLQHKDNPVHWWAWGPAALAEAERTGKPMLLSVGYAACHWCHVMAHESFEDAATAAVMNDLYVCIKVDREERPDIDAIYMGALHRMGEQGGWPLTMILDTRGRPFWGGTYFPPVSRWGKPSFMQVLREIARIWREEPDKVARNAEALTTALAASAEGRNDPDRDDGGALAVTDDLLRDVTHKLVGAVDPVHGGLKGAPKFPQWSVFWLLWRGGIRFDHASAREAVHLTLTRICQGGIYDHLGGGFARYSVDERWLVPHFEKMLYDNALLIDLMTEVWRETKDPLLAARISETVSWLSAEMIAEGGGFAASLDADSEGEEGKFYVWSLDEIIAVLGKEDARPFAEVYDVTAGGNFEGHTILNRLRSGPLRSEEEETRLAAMRDRLLARRAGRVRPGWDDKVLADWNGLMIAALARAARVLGRPDWLALATSAFDFVASRMSDGDRLWHSSREGRTTAPATAADYANMIAAAIRLHEATLEPRYLEAARGWTGVLDRHYWLSAPGGYAFTADDTADVLVRLRGAHDDAVPNANATMISNLVMLYLLTGEAAYAERADALLAAFAEDMARGLIGHSGMLAAAFDLLGPQQVAIVGAELPGGAELLAALDGIGVPGALEIVSSAAAMPGGSPLLAGKTAIGGRATAYVCLGPQCSPPVTTAVELTAMLGRQRQAHGST